MCPRPTAAAAGWVLILCLAAASTAYGDEPAPRPLALHPDNPHYFLFRGKPTVLIASGEHYGAVLNLDFDYAPYLDELKAKDLNLTRTFSGYYREVPGSFGIRGNTLAPAKGRYSAPWSTTPDGKYDLTKWDENHFRRMRDFIARAGERGVVVEMVVFCPFYEDVLWDIDPLNAKNNVNGVGKDIPRKEVNALKHKDLVAAQEALARKVVAELKDFDNVYFEICNEPYFGGDDDWQRHMAKAMADAEKDLPEGRRHLIAQNIANGSKKIESPDPAVSVFNFHYCNPPDAVGQNHDLNRVIGYDETGFKGSGDDVYRVHGWQFLLAGGAVYSHLDYSFTPDAESGTAEVSAPGGGGAVFRAQMQTLRRFMDGLAFVRMKPDRTAVKGERGDLPKGVTVNTLVEPDKQYAAYVARVTPEKKDGKETGRMFDPAAGQPVRLTVDLPAGSYRGEWIDPKTGKTDKSADLAHPGGHALLESPAFTQDVALKLTARDSRKAP